MTETTQVRISYSYYHVLLYHVIYCDMDVQMPDYTDLTTADDLLITSRVEGTGLIYSTIHSTDSSVSFGPGLDNRF